MLLSDINRCHPMIRNSLRFLDLEFTRTLYHINTWAKAQIRYPHTMDVFVSLSKQERQYYTLLWDYSETVPNPNDATGKCQHIYIYIYYLRRYIQLLERDAYNTRLQVGEYSRMDAPPLKRLFSCTALFPSMRTSPTRTSSR